MKALILFLLALATLMFSSPARAQGEWELYDNFESGVINSDLWELEDSGSQISISEGKLRFEIPAGSSNQSGYLFFRKDSERIKAIKARVTVQSCSGDVRARIGGYTGADRELNPIYNAMIIQCADNRIFGKAVAEEYKGDLYLGDLYVLYKGIFKAPANLVGKTFIITTTFNPGSIIYTINGRERSIFVPSPPLLASERPQKYIGVKSSGDPTGGPSVILFDDIQVLYY